MAVLPKSIIKTIEAFSRLPSIGPKTASRLTFYLLNQGPKEIEDFGNTVLQLRHNLMFCSQCFNISEEKECTICLDKTRDDSTIMVVSEPLDIVALERTGYKGLYHILGGLISPIDGVGPNELNITSLIERAKSKKATKEIILATDPSLEGEATSLYIANLVHKQKELEQIDKKLEVSRIARGLPMGGDVEYADEVTLTRALEGRKSV